MTLDQGLWMLHRDQMDLLRRIEHLLMEDRHERRAEIKDLTAAIKSTQQRGPSFEWRDLINSTLAKVVLLLSLGASGAITWSEAIKVATQ